MSTLEIAITLAAGSFSRALTLKASSGITAVVGPSGCGKSTTLSCIAGLSQPVKGNISFGDSLWFDSVQSVWVRPQLRRIGYVLQNSALFPHLNVFDNIAFGLSGKTKMEARTYINELAEMFNFAELLERKPNQLSGGQAQKIALARALAPQPKLLLLDEPFSALDKASRSAVAKQLRLLQQQQNSTVVLVTHYWQDNDAIADAVIDIG